MKRHPALWLTVLLAVFYILLGNGRNTSGDGEAMLQVARALVEHGTVALPPGILRPVKTILADSSDTEIPYVVVGHDGATYSKYGLGQSLVGLPLYVVGMAWRAVANVGHAPRSAALLLNSLLTAGTAGLLLVLVRDLGCSMQTGVVLALAYGLCSPAWVYTRGFFAEPLVAFCLTGAAVSAVRFSQSQKAYWLGLCGGFLGLALLARIDALAALPAFGIYLVLTWRRDRPPWHVVARQAAAGLAGLGLGVGLMLLYNSIRFGNAFDFGYYTSNWQTPFWRGLFGLVLSPGKGILWYAPVVVLGLLGFRPFARQWPGEAWLCAAVSLGYLLLHSPYTYWEGGWSWGPRLILPALPFLLLPGAAIVGRRNQPQAIQLGVALILVLGLVVQIPAIGSDLARTLQRAYSESPEEFQTRVLFQPSQSPLIQQWRTLVEVTSNLRSDEARTQIKRLLATVEPDEALLLTDSYGEAVRLDRQTVLAFNLPDLWLVSMPWLQQKGVP